MDLLLEALEDPAYRHVLSNHLPVSGLAVAWIVLLWGVVEGRVSSIRFALALVLAMSGSALLVMSAGEAAYPFVFDSLDGTGRAWLDHHVELADRWGLVIELNALAAAAAIALGVWRDGLQRIVGGVLLLTTLVSLLLAVVIAEAGGKVRHDEFRLTDPPVLEGEGRLR